MERMADKGWFGLDPANSYGGIKGRRGDNQEISFDPIDHFAAGMDDFAGCILNNCPSRVSGVEGLRDLKVVETIYKSIATGRTVRMA